MSDIIFLEKIPRYAQPVDDDAKRIFDSFRIGQKFEVIPWKERNYLFHKKLYALINLVVYRNRNWKSAYFLLKLIQIDIGSVEVGRDLQGQIKQFPKSIAFKSMSEPEFTTLFSNTVDYLLAHLEILLPGMRREEFNTYVDRILHFT